MFKLPKGKWCKKAWCLLGISSNKFNLFKQMDEEEGTATPPTLYHEEEGKETKTKKHLKGYRGHELSLA